MARLHLVDFVFPDDRGRGCGDRGCRPLFWLLLLVWPDDGRESLGDGRQSSRVFGGRRPSILVILAVFGSQSASAGVPRLILYPECMANMKRY